MGHHSADIHERLLRYLQAKWKESGRGELVFGPVVLPLGCPQAPTQTNAYDCGVYVLRFAKEICQMWPVVTAADVNDGMQAHFNLQLFNPSDITEERRMLGKLQDRKARYERAEEQQSSKKRKARDNTHGSSSRSSEVEEEEPPPTMSSETSTPGLRRAEALTPPTARSAEALTTQQVNPQPDASMVPDRGQRPAGVDWGNPCVPADNSTCTRDIHV